jgi:FkbM family methyltransferase
VGLAKLVENQGRVLAFEPQPVIFQNLCANLSLNSITNVDAFHCGLGDAAATINLPHYRYDQPFNYAGIGLEQRVEHGLSVDIKTFDEVFRYPRLKLIKIDVEGMEEHVLRGARQSIQKFKPVLYLENDRADRSVQLIELLMSMDYRLWWHLPPLFNPNNFFGEAENIFPNVASLNMLCLH